MKQKIHHDLEISMIVIGLTILVTTYLLEIIITGTSHFESGAYYKLFAATMLWLGIALRISAHEKNPIKKAISTIKTSKKQIYGITLIFFLTALFGYILADQLSFLDDLLLQIFERALDLSFGELFGFIFLNNTFSSISSIVFGAVLGLMPLFSTLSNGLVLGYVIEKAGILSAWRLLPHGILELPAIFISFGLGLKFGIDIAKNYFKQHKKNQTMRTLGIATIVILPISFLLSLLVSLSIDSPSEATPAVLALAALINLALFASIAFFLIFFIFHKKARPFLFKRSRDLLYVLTYIIVPVLALAALIETILIALS